MSNVPAYHMLNGGGQKIILEEDGVIVLEVYTDIADFIKEGRDGDRRNFFKIGNDELNKFFKKKEIVIKERLMQEEKKENDLDAEVGLVRVFPF